ncbi:DUF5683 domain-containing protein [Membranihabitans marinus]|uniref:DUF5683 domain-containing protein n=1 Tax=Membranihabitans marinus TaxID=1227546 RepID=UPI001F1F7407|nr:DUF5683 domain-containing protein [Membranihabitans marinus]
MNKWYYCLVLVFFTILSFGQQNDGEGIQLDTSAVQSQQKKSDEVWSPNPKKAVMLSFILPGAGQVYNRSWWKTPLIYAGLGVGVYAIVDNRSKYKEFQTAYIKRINNEPDAPYLTLYPNDETIKRIRDIYYKRFQLGIIGTAAVYLLNGVEAYVDAHLKNFEISEDLSFGPGTSNGPPIITSTIPIFGLTYKF